MWFFLPRTFLESIDEYAMSVHVKCYVSRGKVWIMGGVAFFRMAILLSAFIWVACDGIPLDSQSHADSDPDSDFYSDAAEVEPERDVSDEEDRHLDMPEAFDEQPDVDEAELEEEEEFRFPCFVSSNCPDGLICGPGGFCKKSCLETGCELGNCNENTGLCGFCQAQCSEGQCCNYNQYEFWYCGNCCSPPCPEGTACMAGDCVDLECPESCDVDEICGPETGYVCERDPDYVWHPVLCNTNLETEKGLTLTSIRSIPLPLSGISTSSENVVHSDWVIAPDGRPSFSIAASEATANGWRNSLHLVTLDAREGFEIDTIDSSLAPNRAAYESLTLRVDSSGAFHVVYGENINLRYFTGRNHVWESRTIPMPWKEGFKYHLHDMDLDGTGCPHVVFSFHRYVQEEMWVFPYWVFPYLDDEYDLLYGSFCGDELVTESMVTLKGNKIPEVRLRVDFQGNPVAAFIDDGKGNNDAYAGLVQRGMGEWDIEALTNWSLFSIDHFDFELDSDANRYISVQIKETSYYSPRFYYHDTFLIQQSSELTCLDMEKDIVAFAIDAEDNYHLLVQDEKSSRYCTDRFGGNLCTFDDAMMPLGTVKGMAVTEDGRVHVLHSDELEYVSFMPSSVQ